MKDKLPKMKTIPRTAEWNSGHGWLAVRILEIDHPRRIARIRLDDGFEFITMLNRLRFPDTSAKSQ